MSIPNWLKSYLKQRDIDGIVESIKAAEQTTAGEIVPMIVRRSSTLGHVPVITLALLIIMFLSLGGPTWQSQLLGAHWAWYLLDAVLLVALTASLSRLSGIQRLLTTRTDQIVQVNQRSELEFFESNIKATKDATGILIFVSLLERRAVVIADKAVNDQVAKETWQEVCDLLITGIKKKDMGKAFCDAISLCGDIMTPLFPIQPDDTNELKDQLIIKA